MQNSDYRLAPAILRLLAPFVVLFGTWAAPAVLPRPETLLSDTANGPSGGAAISADARFVAFVSVADNLVAGVNPGGQAQIFVRDLVTGGIQLASVGTNGAPGNGHSMVAKISEDGRWLVFQSDASNLVAGDTNGVTDIFARNLMDGVTTLVSVGTNGLAGNGVSRKPFISSDGRRVVFESLASNLSSIADTNAAADVYFRDLAAGTNGLVSFKRVGTAAANAASTLWDLSGDGRQILFSSAASDLGPGTITSEQFWAHDLGSRTNLLMTARAGTSTVYPLQPAPALSRNGTALAFFGDSRLTNASASSSIRIFYRPIGTTNLTVVPTPPNTIYPYAALSLSPSGARLAVATQRNVFVWDAASGQVVTVTNTAFGLMPQIVEMVSDNSLLIGAAQEDGVEELAAFGGTLKVRRLAASYFAQTDATAVPVVVVSDDAPAGPGDLNGGMDVLIRGEAGTEIISRADPALRRPKLEIEAHRGLAAARDGDEVVFVSNSSRLTPGDTNEFADIFAWKPATAEVRLLSGGTNGPANGASRDPAAAANGAHVAFFSRASNLVEDANGVEDVFVTDTTVGIKELVSVASAGGAATGVMMDLVISGDGQYVGYATTRRDIAGGLAGRTNVVVRDRQRRTNILVNATVQTTNAPARPVAIFPPLVWFLHSTNLFTFNLGNSNVTFIGRATAAALSRDGKWAAFQYAHRSGAGTNVISLFDTTSGQARVLVSSTNNSAIVDSLSVSDFGRVAFSTTVRLAAEDGDAASDVYVATTNEPPQILLASALTNEAGWNVRAGGPVISADGQRVYFRASAVRIGEPARWTDIYVTDLPNGTPRRVATAEGDRPHAISKPLLMGDRLAALLDYNDAGMENPSVYSELMVFPLAAPAADSDGDGLPDAWEWSVFGNLSETSAGDFDGDGMSNGAEFLAGTDPKAPGSVLRLELAVDGSGKRISYPRPSQGNVNVEFRADLQLGSWTNLEQAAVTNQNQVTVVDPAVENQRFYRLRFEP